MDQYASTPITPEQHHAAARVHAGIIVLDLRIAAQIAVHCCVIPGTRERMYTEHISDAIAWFQDHAIQSLLMVPHPQAGLTACYWLRLRCSRVPLTEEPT